MQCPKCKISTLIRTRGGAVVAVCRNPRCKNFDKTVTVLEVIEKKESAVEKDASVETEASVEQSE